MISEKQIFKKRTCSRLHFVDKLDLNTETSILSVDLEENNNSDVLDTTFLKK